MSEKELIYYQTEDGKEPLREWLLDLKDKVIRTRIERRLERILEGNYGDFKSVGAGVLELRFFFGAGYRVYFAEDGDTLVLLLTGGDKSSQDKDIEQAKVYWQDYLSSKTQDDKKEDDQ